MNTGTPENKSENKSKSREKKKQARKDARAGRRMRFWYGLLRDPARIYTNLKLNFKAEKAPAQPNNFLLLYNHNTDFDFILTGLSFREPMYFVASEHILQKGLASRLLSYFFSPIGRLKGTTAASTVMQILHTLKRGDNVCLAAEGDRSWNGITRPILFSTGKLAKSSGAALITYRITGGYLTTPRWSYSPRRGRMKGEIVNIYSPEKLSTMSAKEINDAINRDLYEDAYARQAQTPTEYKGARLAEGLEHALYICPECGKLSQMKGKDNIFSCTCGMKVTYDTFGYLNGGRFSTVAQWDAWQTEELHKLIDNAAVKAEETGENIEILHDENCVLYAIDRQHNRSVAGRGACSMTVRELTVGENVFPLSEMSGLAVYGRKTMVFEHGGTHYEISSDDKLCCTKYEEARKYIVEKK